MTGAPGADSVCQGSSLVSPRIVHGELKALYMGGFFRIRAKFRCHLFNPFGQQLADAFLTDDHLNKR